MINDDTNSGRINDASSYNDSNDDDCSDDKALYLYLWLNLVLDLVFVLKFNSISICPRNTE